MTEDLLFDMLVILVPICLYPKVLNNNRLRSLRNLSPFLTKTSLGIMTGIVNILCMLFPASIGNGFPWGFHYIPLYLSTVYFGYLASLVAIGITIIGRLLIIGLHIGSLFYGILNFILITGPAFYIHKKYFQKSLNQKLFISTIYSIYSVLVMTIEYWLFYKFLNYDNTLILVTIKVFFIVAAVKTLIFIVCVLLLESIFQQELVQKQLQHSEKMQVVSELAAAIAHEVRNPLTVVRGFLQLAKQSMDKKNQFYMDTAILELDRAEMIISDYLSFARPQIEKLELVNLSEMIHTVTNIMSSFSTMNGVMVQTTCEDNLYINADPSKFKQALMNLIKNGIEAIQNQGHICITAFRENDRAYIRISDSGHGMTKEQLEQLGHPFFSTKEKGTGLGLMVTFRLIEALNGTLDFESKLGVGTEALIILPAVEPNNMKMLNY